MKKIKFLLMAFLAMTMSASFVGCDDDDNTQQNNFTKYLSSVESQVKTKKAKSNNKKALLLVAFGSTWENAHQTFKDIVSDYESDQASRIMISTSLSPRLFVSTRAVRASTTRVRTSMHPTSGWRLSAVRSTKRCAYSRST